MYCYNTYLSSPTYRPILQLSIERFRSCQKEVMIMIMIMTKRGDDNVGNFEEIPSR
jgi:hypothetical protein